jgi:hypothetical protein
MIRKGNALSVLRRVFVSAVGCALMATNSAWAQGVSDRGCYGDTIEVVLVNQITGEPKIPMSIPLDAFPVIYGYRADGKDTDPAKECLQEPVLVNSIYFYPSSKPSSVLGIPETGPFPRRYQLYYGGQGGKEPFWLDLQRKMLEKNTAEGKTKKQPNGFIKVYPTPTDAGRFIAPTNYKTPFREAFELECAPMPSDKGGTAECKATYATSEEVGIFYWFMTDVVRQDQWIEIDQLMRKVAVRFASPDYLKKFQK